MGSVTGHTCVQYVLSHRTGQQSPVWEIQVYDIKTSMCRATDASLAPEYERAGPVRTD